MDTYVEKVVHNITISKYLLDSNCTTFEICFGSLPCLSCIIDKNTLDLLRPRKGRAVNTTSHCMGDVAGNSRAMAVKSREASCVTLTSCDTRETADGMRSGTEQAEEVPSMDMVGWTLDHT